MTATLKTPALSWALAILFTVTVLAAYSQKTRTAAPDSADAHLASGLQLHRQGDVNAAIREYLAAAALNPRSALAHYDLGVAYYQQQRVDDAFASYQRALALDDTMADAHYNLAYLLSHDRRDFTGALEHLKRTVEINPRFARAYFEMGVAYDALGMPERARAQYGVAATLDPAIAALPGKASLPASQTP